MAQSNEGKDCYTKLQNDTLYIGNSLIERQFLWNKGNLISTILKNKESGQAWILKDRNPTTSFPFKPNYEGNGSFKSQWNHRNWTASEHLEVEVSCELGKLSLKKVFRIYPNTPAIACDFFVKGIAEGDWKGQKIAVDMTSGVEKKILKQLEEQSPVPVMDKLVFDHGHWKFDLVDFKDVTDINNNLVKHSTYLTFTKPLLLRGNLLFAKDLKNGGQLFMLKEAPLSDKQLHYPGYDFYSKSNELRAVGLGLTPSDIKKEDWTKAYSLAVGVAGRGELNKLSALRKYQKKLRIHYPERDEMVMMNTWGDRGQDGKLNEDFAIRELEAAAKLGITHFQLDDGWQKGLSKNSKDPTGKLWNSWDADSWRPHPQRFPNGLEPILKSAKELNIKLALWFHPSDADSYGNWGQDAEILLSLYKKYGITNFKIDGIELPNKQAENNLRSFLNKVLEETEGQVVFNLDATAGKRGGYHYMQEYGNVFLENRYTDWGNYYPHWTLRNAWMLSRYVPLERFQLEFLNKWRNRDKYAENDPFIPFQLPFDYQFAITMMGQPLAWFEGSNLPNGAFSIANSIQVYKKRMYNMHSGTILPIGKEPSGKSWTGFQSITDDRSGYFLVFREGNEIPNENIRTWIPENERVSLTCLLGSGKDFETTTREQGKVEFSLPEPHSYALYRYFRNDVP